MPPFLAYSANQIQRLPKYIPGTAARSSSSSDAAASNAAKSSSSSSVVFNSAIKSESADVVGLSSLDVVFGTVIKLI